MGGPAWPRPVRPRLPAWSMYLLQRAVRPNSGYRRLAAWLEARPGPGRLFTAAERGAKRQIFGCSMCGQCALPVTGYACPMTCPKRLRNGPCGGVGADGSCEVFPEERCVWLVAFERAESQGRESDLLRLQRPVDHRLWGESSWISYWQGRDAGLWTDDDGLAAPPDLGRTTATGVSLAEPG
jgi:Methylene-tetrahydrofolate reductase C terminal